MTTFKRQERMSYSGEINVLPCKGLIQLTNVNVAYRVSSVPKHEITKTPLSIFPSV